MTYLLLIFGLNFGSYFSFRLLASISSLLLNFTLAHFYDGLITSSKLLRLNWYAQSIRIRPRRRVAEYGSSFFFLAIVDRVFFFLEETSPPCTIINLSFIQIIIQRREIL